MQNELLDRVRKLLAKAEDEGCTPHEAEALTAKAAELMARYGIDRALLGAVRPDTDRPADRVFELDNPWAGVKAHLLAGLASALRCQCILVNRREPGSRVHVFGYLSDLERADILFTSLLVQMARVRAAEEAAVAAASSSARAGTDGHGPSAAVVLADRSMTVRRHAEQAYPRTRKTRVTYSGNGYQDGYREGQKADIGGAKVRPRSGTALSR